MLLPEVILHKTFEDFQWEWVCSKIIHLSVNSTLVVEGSWEVRIWVAIKMQRCVNNKHGIWAFVYNKMEQPKRAINRAIMIKQSKNIFVYYWLLKFVAWNQISYFYLYNIKDKILSNLTVSNSLYIYHTIIRNLNW